LFDAVCLPDIQLRKIAFAIKNSSTILLPRWHAILKDLKLGDRVMPRDVATRWNSTYEMLKFAVEYRAAIVNITADRKLRDYEMDDDEWDVAEQLNRVLKVRAPVLYVLPQLYLVHRSSRMQHFIFHELALPTSRL
jgi:hypothetical protein